MGTAAGTGMSSRLSRAPGSVPSHVYRPTYQMSGGLSSTPQAQSYGSYMPTYTRPSIPMQQPTYQIPSGPPPTPQQQLGKLFGRMFSMTPAGQAVTAGLDRTPTGQLFSRLLNLNEPPPPPTDGYRVPYMTRAQYDAVNNQSDIGNRVIRARASQLSTDGSEGG